LDIPPPSPSPCAKEALSILGRAISSAGGEVAFASKLSPNTHVVLVRIKREVAGLRAAFEQFDKNKDGVLERGEFRRGIFLLKAGLTAAHISEIMQARDEMTTT
jgi:hypothetical protein